MEGEMFNPDPWRKAILNERQLGPHDRLLEALEYISEQRERALVLGDASLIQVKYLIEHANFQEVVDVDSSPSLLDDDVLSLDNAKVIRVVSTFDNYNFPERSFDFVYGKSIAFNPKETTPVLLIKISKSLKQGGIFSALWAREKDEFRKEHYREEELRDLYKKANFEIIKIDYIGPTVAKGLLATKTEHAFSIIAQLIL